MLVSLNKPIYQYTNIFNAILNAILFVFELIALKKYFSVVKVFLCLYADNYRPNTQNTFTSYVETLG